MMTRTIRTSNEKIIDLLWDTFGTVLDVSGDANLLHTGAKAYYRGSGWWNISGYAADDSDVTDIINALI